MKGHLPHHWHNTGPVLLGSGQAIVPQAEHTNGWDAQPPCLQAPRTPRRWGGGALCFPVQASYLQVFQSHLVGVQTGKQGRCVYGPAGTVKHDAIESSGEAIHLKMIKCRSLLLYIEGRFSVPQCRCGGRLLRRRITNGRHRVLAGFISGIWMCR